MEPSDNLTPVDEQAGPPVDSSSTRDRAAHTITNSIGMKLSLNPAGEFMMGHAASVGDTREDETPRHHVQITEPFYIGVYEVTQAEYERVMGNNPSFFSSTGVGKGDVAGRSTERFPVEQVPWHDAVEFCRRLSSLSAEQQAGRVYRLPTEAQWELACRGGTHSPFHYGESLSSNQANVNGKYPYGSAEQGPFLGRTTEVGSYLPNALGLYDMHGNVWEWCADRYGADYYSKSPRSDPKGPESGTSRVIRGGGWRSDGRDCRSGFRYADMPSGRYYVMGFRVAMQTGGVVEDDAPPSSQALTPREVTTAATAPVSAPKRRTEDEFQGEEWPRWRGPRGDGTWNGPKLSETWPESGLVRLWQQPIGGGYSGVVVANGRVYTMDYKKEPDEQERVLCFDALTGKPLWSHQYAVSYDDLDHGNGPRSAPTVLGRRIYTFGAVGHLHCLDAASGEVLWSADLMRDYAARLPMWGFAASPLVFEDLLIVHPGAEPDGCLIAFDLRTGKEHWRSAPDEAGYATPILIATAGNWQLVSWTPTNVRGLDPSTGEALWAIPYEVQYGTAIAAPIFAENLVFVSGYWEGSKAIELSGDPPTAQIVWEDGHNLRALMSQPLYRNGYVYLLDKRHGLTCFELKTGKKLWDDGNRMTPKGRNPQATMVWLGDEDRAIVLNSDGELILARLNPTGYSEQARTNIVGPTWSHPAYVGDRVYARSDTELVCVSLPLAVEQGDD